MKTSIEISKWLPTLRAARGIRDSEIENFLAQLPRTVRFHTSDEIIAMTKLYCDRFRQWVLSTRLNTISGLDAFPHSAFAHGTSQVFDAFLLKHSARRLRYFKGEFAYHRILAQAGGRAFLPIEDEHIEPNDVVIISAPFSDTGDWHPKASEVLNKAHAKGVPCLLDLAYWGTCQGLNLKLDHPAIHELAFSLSKWSPVLAPFRIGLRCSREALDDGLSFPAQVGMTNVSAMSLGISAMEKFDADHIARKYRQIQTGVCARLGLTPSPCVIFGIGGDEFRDLNRGGSTHRACISSMIES